MVRRGFHEAHGDFSEVLELVEEAFVEVAPQVKRGIDGALQLWVALCGDAASPSMGRDEVEHRAGIIASVGRHTSPGRGCAASRPATAALFDA